MISGRAYGATVSDRERDDDPDIVQADFVQAVADFVDDLVEDPVDGAEPTPTDRAG